MRKILCIFFWYLLWLRNLELFTSINVPVETENYYMYRFIALLLDK